MYHSDSDSNNSSSLALELLSSASISPAEICNNDPEVREAFEQGLRELAEDILKFHPSLAHILIGMSSSPCPVVHGQN